MKAKHTILAILYILVIAAGCFSTYRLLGGGQVAPQNPEPITPPTPVVDVSTTDFSLKFLRLENNSKNLIYSPLSIKYGLNLLSAGASGTTKSEIDAALEGESLTKYTNVADKLSLANAVFVRNTYSSYVKPSYTQTVQSQFNSELLFDSFESTTALDNWVKTKTFNLIDSIGININRNTEMVLANALAIQLDWQTKFSPENTHGRDFYLADGSKMTTTTLSYHETKTKNLRYFLDEDLTTVSMDLESVAGADLAFAAFMPKSSTLSSFVNSTSVSSLFTTLGQATDASSTKDGVNLYIPKFKFDYSLAFASDLQALGIKQAFSDISADFSEMTSNPNGLFVSEAVHKANIDFSEKGIKAAAITVFAMAEKSSVETEIPHPVEVRIDHPFLFLIYDKNTKEVWFTGTVYTPNSWSSDAPSYSPQF